MTFKRPYSADSGPRSRPVRATAAYAEPNRQQGRQCLDADIDSAGAVDDDPRPCAVLRRTGPLQEHALGAAQVFYTVCIVILLWVLYGYSLASPADPTSSALLEGLS